MRDYPLNLRLLQLGDSALPIGGYSHSWGLEAAIEGGQVRDASDLETWTANWLRHAVGPMEGVVVAGVCRAVAESDWPSVLLANEMIRASLTPPTCASQPGHGRATADAGPGLAVGGGRDGPAACLERRPLAPCPGVCRPSGARRAEPHEALLIYLHQAALGAIGAGVRAIPIGHTHGQQVLARLHDELHRLAIELVPRAGNGRQLLPRLRGLCHAQSTLYTRLFRS